jgi:hypothetical protein
MKYQMIDYLDKMIAHDFKGDISPLEKEGVLSSSGQIILNKLNLMTGAYASNLVDLIQEADMDLQEVINYMENLQEQNQYLGIFYFLLYLFEALEMDIPYLFMQLPNHMKTFQYYIHELIADLKDCSTEYYD